MKRSIILLLCLCGIACAMRDEPSAIHAEPSAWTTPSIAPSPSPVRWDDVLRRRVVRLTLPQMTETVSLWQLGVRADEKGRLTLIESDASAYANALAAAYRIEPTDAVVQTTDEYDTPYRFLPETAGETVDAAALTAALLSLDFQRDEQTMLVPTVPQPPAVTEADLRETHTLLASYTTSFSGSKLGKANRVHNITLAASRINGVTVEPGATFSINKTIGSRTKANGYKLAGAIANGMNTTEYGGGVCQVSTTLFNAVLMADLEVVERYHHSWPMQYAPVGRDATIATGLKDFRFRNTSDDPVTIFAAVDAEQKTISVALYGRHSTEFDHIEIVSEQLRRLPSAPKEQRLDESLPPGTKEIERESRRGRESVTYLDYYAADGTLLKRVTAFEDVYPSIGEIAYVSSDLYGR